MAKSLREEFLVSMNATEKSGDGQRQSRRLAEQCYLIDNWRTYSGFSRFGRDTSGGKEHFNNFTPIHGGSPEVLVSMLTGKPGTQILFDMTPDQKALLVPKIRIFKSYLISKPGESPSKYKDVELHFPSEAISQEDISKITSSKFGRGHGVGIQSFEWIYDGKDPAQVKYSTKCKLTMFFQNLEDFTATRMATEKLDGKALQYRFSDIINPYEAKIYDENREKLRDNDTEGMWRLKAVVGWSLPTSVKDKKLMNDGMLDAIKNCKVVLYLTLTEHDIEFNQDGSIRVTVDFVGALENALQDSASNVFTPLNAKYAEAAGKTRAFEEYNKEGKNNIRVTPTEARAELKRRRREKKEKEEGTQGNPASEISKDEELNERFSEVSTDRLQGIINTYENVKLLDEHAQRRESQRIFIDSLIISNRLKAAVIPIEEIGLWNGKQLKATQMARFRRLRSDLASKGPAGKAELASILREAGLTDESVIEDMVNRRPFQFEKQDESWIENRDVSKLTPTEIRIYNNARTSAFNRGHPMMHLDQSKEVDAFWRNRSENSRGHRGRSSEAANRKLDNDRGNLEKDKKNYDVEDSGEGKAQVEKRDKALAKWVRSLDPANNKHTLNIDGSERTFVQFEFMYFGDIIDIALKNFSNHPDQLRQRILIGDFYFFDRHTQKKVQLNLSDVPVSWHYFMIWYMNRIIKRDIVTMSAHDFIKDIISYIINPMFGTTCYGNEPGESSQNILSVKTSTFNAPAAADGSDRLSGKLGNKHGRLYVAGGNTGLAASVVQGSHSRPDGEKITGLQVQPGTAPTNIFNYTLLYANSQKINRLSGDAKEDSSNGIYHLRVGADRGLAKKFNFKGETRKYAAEASVVDRNQRSDIEGLRGSKYNCDIEMIGNPLFQNGQYIFIDPSMMGFGQMTKESFEKNQRILRLGGYYLIIEVQCSIDSAGFQTTLKTLWENFPTNFRHSRAPSIERASTADPDNTALEAIDPRGTDRTGSAAKIVSDTANKQFTNKKKKKKKPGQYFVPKTGRS